MNEEAIARGRPQCLLPPSQKSISWPRQWFSNCHFNFSKGSTIVSAKFWIHYGGFELAVILWISLKLNYQFGKFFRALHFTLLKCCLVGLRPFTHNTAVLVKQNFLEHERALRSCVLEVSVLYITAVFKGKCFLYRRFCSIKHTSPLHLLQFTMHYPARTISFHSP